MYTYSTTLRIHYALTDQMGVVYYGNYGELFEIARTEAIRNLGFTYKSLEDMGIIMPVSSFNCRYVKGIAYDELVTIQVSLTEWPIRRKITFHGTIHNEAGQLCTTSEVSLLFVNRTTKKLVEIPAPLFKILEPFFV